MLTKSKLAIAAVLILGAASAAQANEPRDEFGGYRVGPLGQSFQGANPVYHRSLRAGRMAYGSAAFGAYDSATPFSGTSGTGAWRGDGDCDRGCRPGRS